MAWRDVTWPGRDLTWPGRDLTLTWRTLTWPRRDLTRSGRDVTWPGRDLTWPGRDLTLTCGSRPEPYSQSVVHSIRSYLNKVLPQYWGWDRTGPGAIRELLESRP